MKVIDIPELHFISIVENTPTAISCILQDTQGTFVAKLYHEYGQYYAICDGMLFCNNPNGDRWSNVDILVWEYDHWVHTFFACAEVTKTKIQWKELENAYWRYLQTYQPNGAVWFKEKYKRAVA